MNLNTKDIDTDRPLAGLVNTAVLRTALAALMDRAIDLAESIAGQIGTPSSALKDALKASLKLALMHTRVDKQIREGEIHNMNIRLRDWILSCTARRLYIRSQIGAQRISRWYKRRDVLAGNMAHVSKSAPKGGFGLTVPDPFAGALKKRKITRRDWFALVRQSAMFAVPQPSMPSMAVTLPRIKFPTITQPKQVEFHPDELTEEFVYEPVFAGEHQTNSNQVPGFIPGSRAAHTGSSDYALGPATSAGTDTEEDGVDTPSDKPP